MSLAFFFVLSTLAQYHDACCPLGAIMAMAMAMAMASDVEYFAVRPSAAVRSLSVWATTAPAI